MEIFMPFDFSEIKIIISQLADFATDLLNAVLGGILTFFGIGLWTPIFFVQDLISTGFEQLISLILYLLANFLPLIIVVLFFATMKIVMGIKMGQIAKMKGHKRSPAFLLCFFLGIIGYVYVLAIPDLNERRLNELNRTILSERAQQ
jgi:hypothetical protein